MGGGELRNLREAAGARSFGTLYSRGDERSLQVFKWMCGEGGESGLHL